MNISKQGLDLIKKYEGFRKDAYLCPANIWTIGYGTTKWGNGKAVKKGDTINQNEALILLRQQINEHASTIPLYVKRTLNQNQFDALASFQYNLGKHILKGNQTLRNALNSGDWNTAVKQLALYNKATVNGKKQVLKGLDNRRKDEIKLFNSPVTPVTPVTSIVSDEVTQARALIRKAVKEGVFKSDHKDVETYTEKQLLKYTMVYLEAKKVI